MKKKILFAVLIIVGVGILHLSFVISGFPQWLNVFSFAETRVISRDLDAVFLSDVSENEKDLARSLFAQHSIDFGESQIDSVRPVAFATLVELQTYKDGLPIFGEFGDDASVFFYENGTVGGVEDVHPDIQVSAVPSIGPLEAARIVRTKMLLRGANTPTFDYQLGYYRKSLSNILYDGEYGEYRLAYRFQTLGGQGPRDYRCGFPFSYVDAHTGEVLDITGTCVFIE